MKVIRFVSYTVLFVAFLSVFGFTVRYVVVGGTVLGRFTEPFLEFIEFPFKVIRVFKGEPVPYEVTVENDFTEINLLRKDIFALNAHSQRDRYVYNLTNIRNDSILHSWSFPASEFVGKDIEFPVAHPLNPILLPDGSIIGNLSGTRNLFRIDKNSNIVWHNSATFFHHSINLSYDSALWCCTSKRVCTINELENSVVEFRDDFITKVDINTGNIIFERSVTDLLISNGYVNLVHGFGNEERSLGTDVYHMNDIQPIFSDGDFWKKGDLLLSLRNRSIILLYRPETNKILRVISGPFLVQHDVDIYSKDAISIFNNNRTHTNYQAEEGADSRNYVTLTLKSSNVVVYNFSDSSFSMPFLDVIEQEKIYTTYQGIHTFLSDGSLFIESTEAGKIYLIKDGKVIMRKYANPVNDDGTTEYPHWMTIYEDLKFLNN